MARRAGALVAALAALALASVMAPAARAAEAFAPPVTIDGPSGAVVSLGGVALAQDGSGAVVYTKLVAGVPHVFVSTERAGTWGAPTQLDAAIAAAASAPEVAVANGGRVAVVWTAGGTLYGTVEAAGTTAFTAPQAIAPASGQPALGMGISGTAYVAYLGGAANVIDVARLDRTSTSFVVFPAPMSSDPITPASTGAGPVIAVAADATGVVAWTALAPDGSTHVFVRRVSAAGPSPVLDDATVTSLEGSAGGSADSPSVGVAYDSSDAWVAFRETVGGISRVIVDELLGDELRPPVFADSLAAVPGAVSAASPSLAINGNAQGLLASGLAPSNALSVAVRGSAAAPYAWTPGALTGAATSPVAPDPVAALSADGEGVVVFTPSDGALDGELVKGGAPVAATPIATGTLGAVQRGEGVAAAADDYGDLLVGFVAGTPGALAIAVEPILPAPGAPRAVGTQLWTAVSRPVLRWQLSSDHWAPPTYVVYVDGRRVATTTGASYEPPTALADGRHTWRVVATDGLGHHVPSQMRRLLIDVAPPTIAIAVSGRRHSGKRVTFTVSASAISGVRGVSVDYGDGHATTQLRSTHAYARAGRYLVSVVATDRAGVTTHRSERVAIS
jgi:hypothetical protein